MTLHTLAINLYSKLLREKVIGPVDSGAHSWPGQLWRGGWSDVVLPTWPQQDWEAGIARKGKSRKVVLISAK